MDKEERKSCDLTDFILNEFESRLAENNDMDNAETDMNLDNTDTSGEVNKAFVNIDMDEAYDDVEPRCITIEEDFQDNARPISILHKDNPGRSNDRNKHQPDPNSNHIKFIHEDLDHANGKKQEIPLAWKMLSKKRKNTQKKKKTKWAKVRDNLKIVNFMRSVTTADVSKVKRDLEHNPFLTTYTDDNGISSLEKAVNSKSIEIVKLFIDNTKEAHKGDLIEHAILYAIKMDCVASVSFLLDEREQFWKTTEEESTPKPRDNRSTSLPYQRLLNFKMKEADAADPKAKELRAEGIGFLMAGVGKNKLEDSRERAVSVGTLLFGANNNTVEEEDVPPVLNDFEDAEFSSYTTPIILAAKLERLDIIKLLIEKDASEIHPMTMPCPYETDADCDICNEKKLFKRSRYLEDSNHMIEIYRALSSPAYIFLSGVDDPVLEAFVLSKELDAMQEEDPSFRCQYAELSKKCRLFAEELLGLCRTTEEVETMLRREEGVKDFDRAGTRTGLSRVIVAMNYDQKEFIAHPYCQQVLQKSWYNGLPHWVHETEYHYMSLLIYSLIWALVWPVACIMFMLKMWPWVINIMKTPVTKFITDTFSYLTFLLCILINSNIDHSRQVSGDFFNPVEILIILWIIGLLARQFKMFWRHRNAWKRLDFAAINRDTRWSDVVISTFFTLWAILRLAGFIYAHASDTGKERRQHWHQLHPILVAEAFYCAGTVVSFLKITSLFTTSSTLGPMQISLLRMTTDIVRFLTIFIVIMVGFIVAIKTLYSNYADHSADSTDQGIIYQSQEYVGFRNTINTLFWHIFGYGDVHFADIVVNTTFVHTPHVIPEGINMTHINSSALNLTLRGTDQNGTRYEIINKKHNFTQGVGYTLVGIYHIVILIVLLNMLIAMMNNSYQAIVEDSDTEWKFARTRLRMTYYNEVGSLPPPFNVWILGTIMKYVIKLCGKCSIYCKKLEEKTKENLQGSVHREQKSEYKDLMAKINKRYWNKKTSRKNNEIIIAPENLENLLRGGRKSQQLLYGAESQC